MEALFFIPSFFTHHLFLVFCICCFPSLCSSCTVPTLDGYGSPFLYTFSLYSSYFSSLLYSFILFFLFLSPTFYFYFLSPHIHHLSLVSSICSFHSIYSARQPFFFFLFFLLCLFYPFFIFLYLFFSLPSFLSTK